MKTLNYIKNLFKSKKTIKTEESPKKIYRYLYEESSIDIKKQLHPTKGQAFVTEVGIISIDKGELSLNNPYISYRSVIISDNDIVEIHLTDNIKSVCNGLNISLSFAVYNCETQDIIQYIISEFTDVSVINNIAYCNMNNIVHSIKNVEKEK